MQEVPFGESGDWSIVNTSYFDSKGKLFAMERYLATFNNNGCGANILKETETDYYEDGKKIDSRYHLLDENDREINLEECPLPVANDRYVFALSLDAYLNEIGYRQVEKI